MSGGLRRRAVVAVLAFVLMACGGDDSTTDAGASGDGGAEGASTSVADAGADGPEGDDHDDHDDEGDDHDDEGDDHEGDEHDDERDDHEGEEHDDADHEGEEHEGDDHDDHDDDEHGSSSGLGAHEHGVAELSVAWSGGEVVIDLISPTHNLFGFEHEPATDDERALVADRTEALSEPGVIVINDEAGCEVVDEVTTEVEFEGTHAELAASWLFSCANPDEIRQLDVAALFDEFPNLEDIDAQWASPSGQSAAELSPSATVLDLK